MGPRLRGLRGRGRARHGAGDGVHPGTAGLRSGCARHDAGHPEALRGRRRHRVGHVHHRLLPDRPGRRPDHRGGAAGRPPGTVRRRHRSRRPERDGIVLELAGHQGPRQPEAAHGRAEGRAGVRRLRRLRLGRHRPDRPGRLLRLRGHGRQRRGRHEHGADQLRLVHHRAAGRRQPGRRAGRARRRRRAPDPPRQVRPRAVRGSLPRCGAARCHRRGRAPGPGGRGGGEVAGAALQRRGDPADRRPDDLRGRLGRQRRGASERRLDDQLAGRHRRRHHRVHDPRRCGRPSRRRHHRGV